MLSLACVLLMHHGLCSLCALQVCQDHDRLLVVQQGHDLAAALPVAGSTPRVAVTPVVSRGVGGCTVVLEGQALPDLVAHLCQAALGGGLQQELVLVELQRGHLPDRLAVVKERAARVHALLSVTAHGLALAAVLPRAAALVSNVVVVAVLQRWVDVLALVAEEDALVAATVVELDGVEVAIGLDLLVVLVADVVELEHSLAVSQHHLLLRLLITAREAAVVLAVAEVDTARVPLALEHGDALLVVISLRLDHVQAAGHVDLAGAVSGRRARLDLMVAIEAVRALGAAVSCVSANAPPLIIITVLVALALERALVVRACGVLVAVVDLLNALVHIDAGKVTGLANASGLPARCADGARGALEAI